MTIIDRVKNHISDNRGKYGAIAGAGAMYGASKIDSPLLNQAGFNVLAKGQNLALDVADKIDPRATVALNDLGMHKIRQEDIDDSNALYNSGVAKFINLNPVDMVNANEHSTEVYNKAMAAKASAQDALISAKNQGHDYIDQGVNYIKGLNPFTENTIPGKTIQIEIKKALLEGYAPEVIVEAVHANHPTLDKNKPENKINRMLLKDDIKSSRTQRDISRSNAKKYEELSEKISKPIINQTINLPLKQADSIVSDVKNPFINKSRLENNRANYYDNLARVVSITNDYNKFSNENDPVRIAKGIKKTHSDMINLSEFKPRHISFAEEILNKGKQ